MAQIGTAILNEVAMNVLAFTILVSTALAGVFIVCFRRRDAMREAVVADARFVAAPR